jgi:hypothetical protein
MKSDSTKRDLPRRNEITIKKSKLAPEDDTKWFFIGVGAIIVAGIVKTFIMDKFGPPE